MIKFDLLGLFQGITSDSLRLAGRQLQMVCALPMLLALLKTQNEVLDLQILDEDLP